MEQWIRSRQAIRAEVRDGLRSDKPDEVAWAAFRAATFDVTDEVADLIAALTNPAAGDRLQRAALERALLDSAIQLDAAVPADVVRRYWTRHPVQSSILFARATGPRDEVLLDILSSASGARWFAAANV